MRSKPIQRMAVLSLLAAFLTAGNGTRAADAAADESLSELASRVRPDFRLGSFASGLDLSNPELVPLNASFTTSTEYTRPR